MVNLKEGVTVEDARRRVSAILGASRKCEPAYFAPANTIDDASIYWLYCWAHNGDGSDAARDVARNVWNDIFDIPYEAFDEEVFYKIASERRNYR
jgi:hypothetical protein